VACGPHAAHQLILYGPVTGLVTVTESGPAEWRRILQFKMFVVTDLRGARRFGMPGTKYISRKSFNLNN